MADSNPKAAGTPAGTETASSGIRLSKNQRKQLLAEIERQMSRTDSPRRLLQRAEQALADGHLDQARRLLDQLEESAPAAAGLDIVRARVEKAEREAKQKGKLHQAEEMLRRYIQQRKKPLAELALETLIELAPLHPRRQEYELWVSDLDQELALQQHLDRELAAARVALLAGDAGQARRHLESLEKLDPTSAAVETLEAELDDAERGRAASADIGRLKETVEELIAKALFDDAEREIERLATMDVPKVSIDFLRQHLSAARTRTSDQAEADTMIASFERSLGSRDWQAAREIAHRFGERFPDRPDAARMFNLVTEEDAAERRQLSLEQGIDTLEKLIAEGKRPEAEVALKLVRQLELDEERLAAFAQQVSAL
ncbi:MAG: hypothetical protein V3T72_17390 [Thermoanaerobaculia bacterium]